jgi:haloalkane dehalogenase
VETELKKAQVSEYTVALGQNVLVPVREQLRAWKGPARMVWGLKDNLFGVQWAEWLDKNLQGSRGVRKVEDANLFFPEEMPGMIADECAKHWESRRYGRRMILPRLSVADRRSYSRSSTSPRPTNWSLIQTRYL